MIPYLIGLAAPLLMHIPDGFLAVGVYLPAWLLSALAIGLALWQTRDTLDERQIPLMGVLAAFIFAAQMLNFPVAGGTSGHVVGAGLAAALLGPWAAVLIMTVVVGIQALVFQDGGLLALGANILNMAVISSFVGYGIYQAVRGIVGSRRWSLSAAGFAGGWTATVVASIAASVELALSGTSPLSLVLPAMFGVHVLIGIGEGLVTAGALAFVATTRRSLVGQSARPGGAWGLGGLLLALAVTLLAPLASPMPDGLERVAITQGFMGREITLHSAPLAGYSVNLLKQQPAIAAIVAGMAGALLACLTLYVLTGAWRRLRTISSGGTGSRSHVGGAS